MRVTEAVIRTENLSKVYQAGKQTTRALDNVTLSVQPGEIFGFLGPNGAGKTTTIRLLLDLIRPTAGGATVFGLDTHKDSVALRRRIGFLPGELNLWRSRTGLQVVQYAGRARNHLDMTHVNELAERLLLDLSKKVRDYSSGNRRKLGLVLALMHKPDLLILDEPTGGLDPLMQQTFHQIIEERRRAGCTVFMSSHVLSEVQAICDRVGILRDGQLKAVERVADLTHADFKWVNIRFRAPVNPIIVARVPGVHDVTPIEGGLRLRLIGTWNPLLEALRDCYVVDIHTEEPTLEEIFLTFYDGAPGTQNARPRRVEQEAHV